MKDDELKANQLDNPLELFTIEEALVWLRISKWKLYDLIRTRNLESVQIGRRRFIPVDALYSYIDRLREQATYS